MEIKIDYVTAALIRDKLNSVSLQIYNDKDYCKKDAMERWVFTIDEVIDELDKYMEK